MTQVTVDGNGKTNQVIGDMCQNIDALIDFMERIDVTPFGSYFYVDIETGSNGNNGSSPDQALATISAAVSLASPFDIINVAPGEYAEDVIIPRTKPNLTLRGVGGKGSVYIATPTTNGTALTNNADDFTRINIGCEGDGTGGGFVNTGARYRSYNSKSEGGAVAEMLTMGTDAQITADTHGDGADVYLENPELCWTETGILFKSSDYGAVTQPKIVNAYYHDCVTACIGEDDVSTIGVIRDLSSEGGVMGNAEDGTPPTNYIDLDSAGSTGIITDLALATATNEADVIQLAAGVMWVANKTEAGVTTARPS